METQAPESALGITPQLPTDWREELRLSLQSVDELVAGGWISTENAALVDETTRRSTIRVPPYYLGLMENRADCPIRLQAIPSPDERDPDFDGWSRHRSTEIYGQPSPARTDPIGDIRKLAAPRLTHRYGDRALLHTSSACSMYCRFCFRKSHLSEKSDPLYDGSFDPAIAYLNEHPEIRELILTGGDPLSLSDLAIIRLLDRLSSISALKVVRIHTRMPVTLPARLTPELIAILAAPRSFQLNVVTHFNHTRELTPLARQKVEQLRRRGIAIYNQNVLLRRVNDRTDILRELYQSLYESGVTPYYLHHADWTPGTFHFRTSVEAGRRLMDELRGRVSGPALPDYVLDVPGGHGKISLLDRRVRLEETGESNQGEVLGEVWRVPTPQTRGERTEETRYLNLFAAPRF